MEIENGNTYCIHGYFVHMMRQQVMNCIWDPTSEPYRPHWKLLDHFNIQEVESVLYIRNGVVLKSSTAVLHVLRDLGYPWKIFFVFIHVPAFIRNAIYKVFAKVRYSFFGRRATCRLPRENELNRFL